jgi:hypothetical protein
MAKAKLEMRAGFWIKFMVWRQDFVLEADLREKKATYNHLHSP